MISISCKFLGFSVEPFTTTIITSVLFVITLAVLLTSVALWIVAFIHVGSETGEGFETLIMELLVNYST